MPVSIANNPALFAVVPKRGAAKLPAHKRNIAEVRTEKLAEFKVKAAIDRADAVLRRLEERQQVLAKQIAQLQKRKASAGDRAARIEDAILTRMIAAGLEKVDGFHVSMSTRNAPAALAVDDETMIPAEYFRTIPEQRAVDKNAVKAALAKGAEIAGVRLTSKVSLVRK
jgi:hypothetical protein